MCHLRPGVYLKYFTRHTCEILTLRFKRPEDVGLFKASLLRLQANALGIRPAPSSPPSDSRSDGSLKSPSSVNWHGSLSPPASVVNNAISDNDGASFVAPTVSNSNGMSTGDGSVDIHLAQYSTASARQPTWRTQQPTATQTNFRVQEGGDRLGFQDDERMTVMSQSLTPRHGWHSSSASQAGSTRQRLARWLL